MPERSSPTVATRAKDSEWELVRSLPQIPEYDLLLGERLPAPYEVLEQPLTDEGNLPEHHRTEKTVTFARSGIVVPWNPDNDSVLQLARDQGVDINTGCEYGDCGTCMSRLLEGTVTYPYLPGARIDPGYCLPCVCRPESSIIVDI